MPSIRKARTSQKPNMKFYQRLTLNQWVWNQFGLMDLEKLTPELKKPHLEFIDEEGVSGFVKQWRLSYPEERRPIKDDALLRYDLNIITHLRFINAEREDKIRLKYFQWLSLMFVEHYLYLYFNDKSAFLQNLNSWCDNFTVQMRDDYGNAEIPPYIESDLNKIAFWNATGSGKTLIMHINYLQYRHYDSLDDSASFILLTPKENLSFQHVDDFSESCIDAKLYEKNESRLGTDRNRIIVLENTKLADKDGDKTVSVKRFGSKNVLFVDEGHRGSSGDTWQCYRDDLCKDGFSFEYSATFGQAAEAAGDKNLFDRYTKCILFDYSYKFFYRDGYGKDYNIINLKEEGDSAQRETYLTACLLTFYQQKKLFAVNADVYEPYNIENPLFVFVGASVNAVRTVNKQKVSDVVDILLFFKSFLDDRPAATRSISNILNGTSGLMDSRGCDIFTGVFPYLTETGMIADAIYTDILSMVFNSTSPNATLHIENLKGISGEIQLRLGDNPPFGIINVGDDSELLKLCAANGFDTANIAFTGGSQFQKITKPGSPINLLIGAKKFTEGWNCWRVSTMGLMNVGRSEGSEIIQLFGRGVRLKGYEMSLKRSKAWQSDTGAVSLPRHIALLETLNVFGVRADYMKQFKEFLEREGVPSDNGNPVTITLPIIKNLPIRKLKTLKVKGGAEFKKDAPKPVFAYEASIGKVLLDCYAKIQFETSNSRSSGTGSKNECKIPTEAIRLLDKENLWTELVKYKKQKGRANITIQKSAVEDLLAHSDWYTLLIPAAEITCVDLATVQRFKAIALTLLQKYLDRFYYVKQNNWESQTVGYELADLTDDNFPTEYTVTTTDNELAIWLRQIEKELKQCKAAGSLSIDKTKAPLAIFNLTEHLYNPLIYKAQNGVEIEVSPVALNDSERKFIHDLTTYVQRNAAQYPEVYLLRNQSRKGIGFFDNSGFYPDFILWIVTGDRQKIMFIDPHGMMNEGIVSAKVRLATEIGTKVTAADCTLYSIILSPTPFADLPAYNVSKDDWKAAGVLFMEDPGYIADVMAMV